MTFRLGRVTELDLELLQFKKHLQSREELFLLHMRPAVRLTLENTPQYQQSITLVFVCGIKTSRI